MFLVFTACFFIHELLTLKKIMKLNITINVDYFEKALSEKMSTINSLLPHECLWCERTFRTNHGLKIHISRMHKVIDIFSI